MNTDSLRNAASIAFELQTSPKPSKEILKKYGSRFPYEDVKAMPTLRNKRQVKEKKSQIVKLLFRDEIEDNIDISRTPCFGKLK
ncbi:unnamed protein product [Dovyalis caffra]|uniref:Uncharacterized protein n=1 Tax=Dovyalis caffra TaxID=77055 RepID=A0AAV1RWR2_9ROSI|nr:unnamed protein product [Dovyalis caffra]